jgi:hypothetical protein
MKIAVAALAELNFKRAGSFSFNAPRCLQGPAREQRRQATKKAEPAETTQRSRNNLKNCNLREALTVPARNNVERNRNCALAGVSAATERWIASKPHSRVQLRLTTARRSERSTVQCA